MKMPQAIPDAPGAAQRELACDLLRSSGSLRLRATGRSMLPTVAPGDTLIVEPARGGDLSEGDIAVFDSGRRFVAHRVVATKIVAGERKIQTRGDAAMLPDFAISDRELLGKVSLIVRNGRKIEPGRSLRPAARAVAALVRRSIIAGRVVVGVHGFRRAVMEGALLNQS